MERRKKLQIDFFVVICLVALTIPTVLFFQARFIVSTLLFFGLPSLYLFLREPKQTNRLAHAVLLGLTTYFSVDFLAELNQQWSWAPEGQLFFPYKILGWVPIDVMIWYFFLILFSMIFYEHFFEHEKSTTVSKSFTLAYTFFFSILVLIILFYFINPEILIFPYAYFYMGFLGSIPLLYVIFKKPNLLGKLLQAGLFFVFVLLSFEVTALRLDQWRFPGEYIGYVRFLGETFPFEEFFFFVLLSVPMMLAAYELFIDDEK